METAFCSFFFVWWNVCVLLKVAFHVKFDVEPRSNLSLKKAPLTVVLVVNELFICCIKNTAFCNFDSSITKSQWRPLIYWTYLHTQEVYMKRRVGRLMCWITHVSLGFTQLLNMDDSFSSSSSFFFYCKRVQKNISVYVIDLKNKQKCSRLYEPKQHDPAGARNT